MNIRKSKVVKNREWSASTQKKLASMLGVSAMISAAALTACDFGSNTTDRNVSGSELSSSSVDLPPESGVVEPPEPTCGELPCDGHERLSSSSEQQNSSSSSEPPLSAGILPPQIDESSSSSYSIDSLEVTSGEIAPPDTLEPESGSPFDQLHDLSSSSTIPEFPPQAGVVEPDFGSSSSSVDVLPSSSSNEVEIDSTLTAGLPVIEESSSSAEERYIPAGDPVLPPEPEDLNN